MPKEVYHAYGYVKKAAALVNTRAGRMPEWKGGLITAMHTAAYKMAMEKTIPALKRLRDACERKSKAWADVVKIGRTHLEDATPLRVGQEWSGYVGALEDAIAEVEHATQGLLKLAMGGTAVGTGLNAPAGFGDQVAKEIASMTGSDFETAPNKFTAQGTLDRMVRAHGGLKAAAVTLFKIANDLRWLGLVGRAGDDGGAEGNFELNAFRPILINNYLHPVLIIADMCDHLREFMIEGAELNDPKLKENIERSVMMVTALSPIIGYDKASVISHYAIEPRPDPHTDEFGQQRRSRWSGLVQSP
jgi:fumarate hydratase, class II